MLSAAGAISGGSKQANTQILLAELKKQKALQLAYASAKGIWSVYTMRQSYISQTLATKWAKQYLTSHSQDIILRTDGQVWNVRFYKKGSGYALSGGWKKFAIDNDMKEDLKEDDVCVFYLDTAAFGAVTLDVSNFRPANVEIGEDAISEAALGCVNKSSGQKKKMGKLLLDENVESD